MWNDVRLLNTVSNALVALALLIAAGAAIRLALESPAFPLRSIRVEGDLRHVGRRDVVNALQGHLSGNFFNMDLDGVRALFEGIPWVRHAEVRRMWPDRLEVRIEEQVALARWGQAEDARLVNVHGELFNGSSEAPLPQFAGPAGSQLEVTEHYDAFRKALGPVALEPVAVVLSPRYSWQVRLSNGMTLQLGRDGSDRGGKPAGGNAAAEQGADKSSGGLADRLARFVDIYPATVAPMAGRVDYADLRYPNGFALHVPGLPGQQKAAGPARPAGKTGNKVKTVKTARHEADTRSSAKNGARHKAGTAGAQQATRGGTRGGTRA